MNHPRPSLEMAEVLDRLMKDDEGQPDPTLLHSTLGRDQAEASNVRWNKDLPEMARVVNLSVKGSSGDIPCRVLTPLGAPRGTIFFIHGGGWSFCSMNSHERCARLLAIEAHATVVMCDYRLAPEDPFPAGLEDCRLVWDAISNGVGAFSDLNGPYAISGDSAGANLSMATMLDSENKPDCGLLFYGVYGADFDTPSYNSCVDGPGLSRDKMKRYWNWYVPQDDRNNPLVTPLSASDAALKKLPPLYLNAAEIDPLRSDSEQMFARLSGLGRKDQFRIHSGVVHGFLQMTLVLEESRIALADAGKAFRSFTKGAEH
ncbi:MAG: alpha/beta hydrolase [Paracoccaceae bacterium]